MGSCLQENFTWLSTEISLDINPPLLEKLEDIQHLLLLCRLLKVGEKYMNAFLFTETAVIPIKYRINRKLRQKIETPEHALLDCKSNAELVNIHEQI